MRTVTDHKQHFAIRKQMGVFVIHYKGVMQKMAYPSIRAARFAVRMWVNALTQQERNTCTTPTV